MATTSQKACSATQAAMAGPMLPPRAESAAKRGRDGPISHMQQQQPLHWGQVKGDPPRAQAYVSRVRVLRMGKSRLTVFDGDRPNWRTFGELVTRVCVCVWWWPPPPRRNGHEPPFGIVRSCSEIVRCVFKQAPARARTNDGADGRRCAVRGGDGCSCAYSKIEERVWSAPSSATTQDWRLLASGRSSGWRQGCQAPFGENTCEEGMEHPHTAAAQRCSCADIR